MRYVFPILFVLFFVMFIAAFVASKVGREDLAATVFAPLGMVSIFLFFFGDVMTSIISGDIAGDQTARQLGVGRNPLWVYFFFMVLPGAFGAVGIHLGVLSLNQGLDTEPADGVVVGIKENVVTVEYEVGQDRLRRRADVQTAYAYYHLGDKVPVRYKRIQPEIALIDSFFQRWSGPLTFLAVAVLFEVFLLAGLMQHLRLKRMAPGDRTQPSGYLRFLWWRWR